MPFVKGQSGNPGGMPKGLPDIKALARQYTEAAIAALVKALDNDRTSVAAATALLDRGYGKPVQEVSGPDGSALLGEVRIVLVKADAKPAAGPNPDALPDPEPGAWS